MEYKWSFSSAALRDLEKLSSSVAKRLLKKIQWFSSQPNPLLYATRLHDPVIGDIRFRAGDYRIICAVNKKEITIVILAIGHRKNIYQ